MTPTNYRLALGELMDALGVDWRTYDTWAENQAEALRRIRQLTEASPVSRTALHCVHCDDGCQGGTSPALVHHHDSPWKWKASWLTGHCPACTGGA